MALAIKSLDEARAVARLISEGKITGDGKARAIADLRAFDRQQRNLENIRKDQESYNPTSGMSGMDKVWAGIGSGMTDVVLGARQLAETAPVRALTGRAFDPMAPLRQKMLEAEAAKKRETDAALLATGAGRAGNVAGQIVATAPLGGLGAAGRGAGLLRLARAGAMQGGAAGAVTPATSGAERALNIATGAGMGAAVPAALRPFGKVAERALDNKMLARQRLQKRGVRLTVADTLDNPAARGLARTGRDTVLGNAAFSGGEAARNKSITKAILKHIGVDADDATPDVLMAAKKRIRFQFDRVFKHVKEVPITRDAADSLNILERERLPHDLGAARAVKRELANIAHMFQNGNKPAPALAVKDAIQKLRERAAGARRSAQIEAAEAYDDIVEALEESVFEAAGPTAKRQLAIARRHYRNLKAIEYAADRDWSGGISHRKLAQRLSTNKYTKDAYGRAEPGSLELLARDLDTVSDNFPNSGTASRISPVIEAGAALGTGGATVPLSLGNAALQFGLSRKAPPTGLLRRALGASVGNRNAGAVINAATIAPIIAALQEARDHGGKPSPKELSALLRAVNAGPGEDVTMDQLEAMFAQAQGGR